MTNKCVGWAGGGLLENGRGAVRPFMQCIYIDSCENKTGNSFGGQRHLNIAWQSYC